MTDAPIFLCRHGETEWNTEGRLQGHRDSPLTARGPQQAARNARRLWAHFPFVAGCRVVSSPLGRASHSARLMVAELGLPETAIDDAPALRECAFGAWEGLTRPEIRARFPEDWAARLPLPLMPFDPPRELA